ncbi:glycosyltransferase family 2 protein [Elongatibacter sediminis]|uniref:Glycosyltransferase family 2 protein n=1 Tax=Elongatibacter sediminis TaxID=3119006 RepID=A0AAW9R764_9GAMM
MFLGDGGSLMTQATGLVTVVVPVYNGAETIEPLVQGIVDAFADLKWSLEIILVNDGSPDASWRVIQKLAQTYPSVQGLNLMRNFGQHNALLAGIRRARGAVIVTMDDDLQNPPEEVPKLLAQLEQGHDVVYGIPAEGRHGLFRDFASVFAKIALRIGLGYQHASRTSAFRAFRASLRNAFADFNSKHVSIDVLLTWATTDFCAVTVDHRSRASGRSGYTLWKLLRHTANVVTSFSTRPLKLASLIGFTFTLFGFGVLIYSLLMFLVYGRSVPGFTFLASAIAIFSGVQLFSLGIIGEYIGRIHQRALNQPCYVIASETADGEANSP